MSKYKPENEIEKWIDQVINGSGGMKSFERHETGGLERPNRETVAEWIIRCLGNPDCKGSKDVLKLINEKRKQNPTK